MGLDLGETERGASLRRIAADRLLAEALAASPSKPRLRMRRGLTSKKAKVEVTVTVSRLMPHRKLLKLKCTLQMGAKQSEEHSEVMRELWPGRHPLGRRPEPPSHSLRDAFELAAEVLSSAL